MPIPTSVRLRADVQEDFDWYTELTQTKVTDAVNVLMSFALKEARVEQEYLQALRKDRRTARLTELLKKAANS